MGLPEKMSPKVSTKSRKSKKSKTTQPMTNHAERFMEMVETFNTVKKCFVEVDELLKKCADEDTVQKKGTQCTISTLEPKKRGQFRTIPKLVVDGILVLQKEGESISWDPSQKGKIPHKWLVCYVNNIFPNTKLRGWKKFQCSHRCGVDICVTPDHLCWESQETRESRKDHLCREKCPNEDCENNCVNMCHCQEIHKPHCL